MTDEDKLKEELQEEKTEELDIVSKATVAAERVEAANNVMKELLERGEKLMARNIMGGKTEAATEKPPKELTDKEYMERVMSGETPNL